MISKATRFLKRQVMRLEEKKLVRKIPQDKSELINSIKRNKLTYLSRGRLASIVETILDLKNSGREGLLIEAGCALGGSSVLIGHTKNTESPFRIYDVFGMIPPPTEEDEESIHKRYLTIKDGKSKGIDGDPYYGYEDDLMGKVLDTFRNYGIDQKKHGVDLVKGLIQDTLLLNEPVIFAHVDVDWYDPVKTCLDRIWPHLIVGGVIILDDYQDWGGCRKATDEFLLKWKDYVKLSDKFGSLKITKISSESNTVEPV